MIKRLILVAVAALAVISAGVLSVKHYHQYQNKKQAQRISQVQAAKQAQYNADQGALKLLQGEITRLGGECQKGANAYAQLPTVAKAKTGAPVCTAPAAAQH